MWEDYGLRQVANMVYSILQELLNYPRINKSKRYNKLVIQIFAKVRYLCKHFHTKMTPGWNIWNTIAIVIALDTLHNNFDMTTTSLLKTGDKTIDQIESILQLKKAKNIRKQTTGAVKNLTMLYKDNNS